MLKQAVERIDNRAVQTFRQRRHDLFCSGYAAGPFKGIVFRIDVVFVRGDEHNKLDVMVLAPLPPAVNVYNELIHLGLCKQIQFEKVDDVVTVICS